MFGKRLSRALALTTVLSLVMTVAAFADQIEADADAVATNSPAANVLSANQQPGTTVAYPLSAAIKATGAASNKVFVNEGDEVNVIIARSGDWLATSPDAGTPTSFAFDDYDVNAAGTIRISVPCGTAAGTTKAMTAVLTGTPDRGVLNPDSVILTYTITAQGDDHADCSPANQAPVLGPIGDRTVAEGSTLSFTVSATDADEDPLTFSMTGGRDELGADDNMSFNTSTGLFSWTPGDNYTYSTVTFTASDGEETDSETVSISSTNVAATTSANASPFTTQVTATGVDVTARFDYSDAGWHDTHTGSFFSWTVDSTSTTSAATMSGTGDTPGSPPFEAGTASTTRSFTPGCYEITVSGVAKDDDGAESSPRTIASSYALDVPVVAFKAPIKDNERNFAKYGNVLPVKVVITSSCTGLPVTTVSLYLSHLQGTAGEIIEGTETVTESVSAADGTGGMMRVADGMYIYNFTTKPLTARKDYTLRVRWGSPSGPVVLQAVLQAK